MPVNTFFKIEIFVFNYYFHDFMFEKTYKFITHSIYYVGYTVENKLT